MRRELVLAPGTVEELRALGECERRQVRDSIEDHLRFEPTRVSKSRIKRLRGLTRPQYGLRIGQLRVFYDVEEATVEILAIISKEQASEWLEEEGIPKPKGSPREGQG
jgi:mRNA-degrading endonuclease RelE of RelBE toxin-antitoxin system